MTASSSSPDHFVIRLVCAAVVLITAGLFAAVIWQATHGHEITAELDKAATAGFVAMIGLLTRTTGSTPNQVEVTNAPDNPVPVAEEGTPDADE